MKRPLLVLLLIALPSLASARCVTADDLATGISFKRQDGRSGTAIANGNAVDIDYAVTPDTAWQDERKAVRGVYEQTWVWSPDDEYIVGRGPGGSYTYKFSGKPPVPTAGESWKSTVRVVESQDYGTDSGPELSRYSYDVTFSFQNTKEVELSGCPYTVLPIEATFVGKSSHFTRRWIYFPDLGFGLETRQTYHRSGQDRKLGLIAMTPKG